MTTINDTVRSLVDLPVISELRSLLPIHHQWGWEFQPVTFEQPLVLWVIAGVPLLLWLIAMQRQPALVHSRLPLRRRSLLSNVTTMTILALTLLSTAVGSSALIASLAHPNHLEAKPDALEMSVDLDFAIDKSNGNMSEFIANVDHEQNDANFGHPPDNDCGKSEQWGHRKIDLSAYAACKIAAAFPKYRKSLATFDGGTQCCSPAANSDSRFFDQRIRLVNQQLGDNGTNYDTKDGVFNVMLNFIQAKNKSENRVLFVFTDGDGTLTDEMIAKYARGIRDRKVVLICGGPGADTVATDPETDAIVKLCKRAGGTIVNLSVPDEVQKAINIVAALPPSQVVIEAKAEPRPIQGPFIFVGVVCLMLSALGWAALGRLR
jgi:hypothetical protein